MNGMSRKRFAGLHTQPARNRIVNVFHDLVERFALCQTPQQGRDLGPIPTFLGLVNAGFKIIKKNIL